MVEPILLCTFEYNDKVLRIEQLEYADGNMAIAICIHETGEPYAVLSVNMPEVPLIPGTFCVKTWGLDNEEIAAHCRTLPIFEDTGHRFPTGYVKAEVWRLKNREMDKW